MGLNEHVVEAYNFICLNYQAVVNKTTGELDEKASDEIFLFGFSRGAYTARALSGLISAIGILKKSHLKHFPAIYEHYQQHNTGPADLKEVEYKVQAKNVRIKVVGVWDTVGSLGVPDAWMMAAGVREYFNKKYSFHDPEISSCKYTPPCATRYNTTDKAKFLIQDLCRC